MVSFSDLDTAFLKPCARCGELLQDHERFCRFCGKDQTLGSMPADKLDALLSARPEFAAKASTSPEVDAEPSLPERSIPTLQDVAPLRKRPQRAVTAGVNTIDGRPVGPPPSSGYPLAALASKPLEHPRESGFGFTTSQPTGAWLDELPSRRDHRALMRNSRRLTGLVLVLALMLGGALWWEHRGDASALSMSSARPAFASQVALVEEALARGDLRAATRGIEALKADHPGEASVASLQARLQGQTNERTAKLQALEEAARRASQALGVQAANDPAAAAVIVSVPASTPGANSSATASGANGTPAHGSAASGTARITARADARTEPRAEARSAAIITPPTPVAAPRSEAKAAPPPAAPSSAGTASTAASSTACSDALAALALCVRP